MDRIRREDARERGNRFLVILAHAVLVAAVVFFVGTTTGRNDATLSAATGVSEPTAAAPLR